MTAVTPWFSISLYDRGYEFITDSLVSGYELRWDWDSEDFSKRFHMWPFRKCAECFWLRMPVERK
jgi:hypothetical protein